MRTMKDAYKFLVSYTPADWLERLGPRSSGV